MKQLLWYFGVGGALLLALLACAPQWLGNSNTFLENFVNHEYINTLGVILAITLASLSQVHLSLNRIEERRKGRVSLSSARNEIKSSAAWMIVLFVAGVLLVVAKPIVGAGERGEGFFNGCALLVLGLNVLILLDVTLAVFDIKPEIGDDDADAT